LLSHCTVVASDPPPPAPGPNSARQPLLTVTRPGLLNQLLPWVQRALDSCFSSREWPCHGVLQVRERPSLLSQRMLPAGGGGCQPPPEWPSDLAMSCLTLLKVQRDRRTWSR